MSRSRRRTEVISFRYVNGLIVMRWREIWTYSVWHEAYRLRETVLKACEKRVDVRGERV